MRQRVDSNHRICEHGRDAFADDCGMCQLAGTDWAKNGDKEIAISLSPPIGLAQLRLEAERQYFKALLELREENTWSMSKLSSVTGVRRENIYRKAKRLGLLGCADESLIIRWGGVRGIEEDFSWNDASKKTPPEKKNVLLGWFQMKKNPSTQTGYYQGGRWYAFDCGTFDRCARLIDPTHWAKIPPAPIKKQ